MFTVSVAPVLSPLGCRPLAKVPAAWWAVMVSTGSPIPALPDAGSDTSPPPMSARAWVSHTGTVTDRQTVFAQEVHHRSRTRGGSLAHHDVGGVPAVAPTHRHFASRDDLLAAAPGNQPTLGCSTS